MALLLDFNYQFISTQLKLTICIHSGPNNLGHYVLSLSIEFLNPIGLGCTRCRILCYSQTKNDPNECLYRILKFKATN